MAIITFHVQDQRTGAPLPGATLHAESPWGPWNGITDEGGNFAPNLGAAHYDLTISKPGYTTVQLGADLEFPAPPAPPVTIALPPSAIPAPSEILNGVDAFMEYRFWLDGNHAQLAALRAERKALGFTWARVFMAGSASQNASADYGFAGLELSPFEPGFRENLRPFAQSYADAGERLCAVMGVDFQIQCAKQSDQLMVWQWFGEAFQGLPVDASVCNEGDKNGVDGKAFPALPGVSCSRGSLTQDMAPLKPEMDWNEFHQRRDHPARENDAVASAVYLRDHGYLKPLRMTEAIPFYRVNDGHSSDDIALAARLGKIYGAEWSGVVAHNRCNQFGRTCDDHTYACMAAWSDGVRS